MLDYFVPLIIVVRCGTPAYICSGFLFRFVRGMWNVWCEQSMREQTNSQANNNRAIQYKTKRAHVVQMLILGTLRPQYLKTKTDNSKPDEDDEEEEEEKEKQSNHLHASCPPHAWMNGTELCNRWLNNELRIHSIESPAPFQSHHFKFI